MLEENIKNLRKELKYLQKEVIEAEVKNYENRLINKVNVKEIAKEIYHKRGIEYSKLSQGIFNNLGETISDFGSIFRNKDKGTKKKMLIDILVIVLIAVFLKVPFDFIRDIGYDYIEIITTSKMVNAIWNLGFLLVYTIVLICSLIIMIRNFNKKYS